MDKYELEKFVHEMKDNRGSIRKFLDGMNRSKRAVEYMNSLVNGCLCRRRHLRDELEWME